MFGSRFERVAMVAGNLFFLVAIAIFVTLILLATGTAGAQEFPLTDSLKPDALEEDTLEPDALDEDALGFESFDPELFRQLAQMNLDLPIAMVPPRPPQAIPMYFCWRCWAWRVGTSRVPLCPHHRLPHAPDPPPVVLDDGAPLHPEIPVKIVKAEEKKQL